MQGFGGRTHPVHHLTEDRKSSMQVCAKLETALKTPPAIVKQIGGQCGAQTVVLRCACVSP